MIWDRFDSYRRLIPACLEERTGSIGEIKERETQRAAAGGMRPSRRGYCYNDGDTTIYCRLPFLTLPSSMAAVALIMETMMRTIGVIMLAPVLARLPSPLLLSSGCDGLPVSLFVPYPDPLPFEDSPEAANGLSGEGSNRALLPLPFSLLSS